MKNLNHWKSLLRNQKIRFVLASLMTIITVLLGLGIPILVGKTIDLMISNEMQMNEFWKMIGMIVVVIAGNAFFHWLSTLQYQKISFESSKSLRNRAFQKVHSLSVQYYDQHSHGDLMNRLTTDIEQISEGISLGLPQLIGGLFTMCITLVYMLLLDYKTTILVIVLTPISIVVTAKIAKKTKEFYGKQAVIRGRMTNETKESIKHQKEIVLLGTQMMMEEKIDQINQSLEESSIRAIFYSSIANPSIRFVNILVSMAVLLFGGAEVIKGIITLGQFSVFFSYANQYTKPFNEISSVFSQLQNAFVCANRVFEFLDEEEEATDSRCSTKRENQLEYSDEIPVISFQQVDFSYQNEKKVLEQINLEVHKGKRLAIVGKTGCGKSTLLQLLLKYYAPQAGTVSLNGVDLNELDAKMIRNEYAMVFQNTWIKNASVLENITLNREDITMQEVEMALERSHAKRFVNNLEHGVHTVIGDRGVELSWGEKQLLCIARAIVKMPHILILDEATSSIDTRTEMIIQKVLANLMEGRTSFVIAHRLSTIRDSDWILVMDDGKVVEQGTHEELMNINGIYKKMYQIQISG